MIIFESFPYKKGEFRSKLKAGDGQVILASKSYKQKS
jgi:uncharacterized protein YegP (UPF0339 family)